MCVLLFLFFFQAEYGIRYLVLSRGLGDVYKRQAGVDPVLICVFGRGAVRGLEDRVPGNVVQVAAGLSLIHI